MKANIFTITLLFVSITLSGIAQDKQKNQTDQNGLKQGYWEKFYPNGKMQYKGTFKNNKPIGEFKRFNQEGALIAVMNHNENSNKVYTKFYYPGKVLQAEGYYIDRKKDSIWIYYTENGDKINEVSYLFDIKNGTEKKYYKNGAVSETSEWKNGNQDGLTMRYYDDGKVMMRIMYKNNKLDGEYNVYGPEENILIQGQYINNKREGKWTYYKDNGHLRDELNYIDGIAENQEELERLEDEQIKILENQKGKIKDPSESMYNAIPPGN